MVSTPQSRASVMVELWKLMDCVNYVVHFSQFWDRIADNLVNHPITWAEAISGIFPTGSGVSRIKGTTRLRHSGAPAGRPPRPRGETPTRRGESVVLEEQRLRSSQINTSFTNSTKDFPWTRIVASRSHGRRKVAYWMTNYTVDAILCFQPKKFPAKLWLHCRTTSVSKNCMN